MSKKKKERLNDKLILGIKDKLKETRLKRGVTQEHVLKTTGIHIGRLENKNYVMNVNISTLHELCEVYKTTLSELLREL